MKAQNIYNKYNIEKEKEEHSPVPATPSQAHNSLSGNPPRSNPNKGPKVTRKDAKAPKKDSKPKKEHKESPRSAKHKKEEETLLDTKTNTPDPSWRDYIDKGTLLITPKNVQFLWNLASGNKCKKPSAIVEKNILKRKKEHPNSEWIEFFEQVELAKGGWLEENGYYKLSWIMGVDKSNGETNMQKMIDGRYKAKKNKQSRQHASNAYNEDGDDQMEKVRKASTPVKMEYTPKQSTQGK